MKTNPKSRTELVVARFPATQLPTRSGPMDYLDNFATIVAKIPKGQAVELNAQLVDEHRCRKFLQLLASRDPFFARLRLRTAPGIDRRRVFVSNPGNIDITADSVPLAATTHSRRNSD